METSMLTLPHILVSDPTVSPCCRIARLPAYACAHGFYRLSRYQPQAHALKFPLQLEAKTFMIGASGSGGHAAKRFRTFYRSVFHEGCTDAPIRTILQVYAVVFDAQGVIVHDGQVLGGSSRAGHYTAAARRLTEAGSPHSWVLCNDDSIRAAFSEEVQSLAERAAILVYVASAAAKRC